MDPNLLHPETLQPAGQSPLPGPSTGPILPPTQTPNEIEETKKLSKKILIIVALLLLILIPSGFYLLSQNKSVPEQAIAPTLAPKATPTPTPDPTANWKTYTNPQFSFTFKYPSDWVATNAYDPKYSPNLKLNLGLIPENKEQGSSVTPIYVSQYDNPNNLPIKEWQDEFNGGKALQRNFYSPTDNQTTIGGVTAYINPKANCEPLLCYQIIIMAKDNVLIFYNVKLTDEEELNNNQKVFDQILSTFKFTDQTSPSPSASPSEEQVVCTQEASLCPDGSYVSREGPNCEFAACPE